jgi:hypothetical protein
MTTWHELRILMSEWLLGLSLRVMPADAPEASPLARAIDGYCDEALRLNAWGKFPA